MGTKKASKKPAAKKAPAGKKVVKKAAPAPAAAQPAPAEQPVEQVAEQPAPAPAKKPAKAAAKPAAAPSPKLLRFSEYPAPAAPALRVTVGARVAAALGTDNAKAAKAAGLILVKDNFAKYGGSGHFVYEGDKAALTALVGRMKTELADERQRGSAVRLAEACIARGEIKPEAASNA
jgi:hypothetical protein